VSERTGDLPALTGLRAIAAWLVFVRHTHLHPLQPEWVTRASAEMHIGVSIFFVLSGFLITLRYYESSRRDLRWFAGYLRFRVARIYPVYFLLTLMSLVVFRRTDPWDWLFNFTMIAGVMDESVIAIAAAWTLTVEEFFYATAPLLFFLMTRSRFLLGLLLPVALGYGLTLALTYSSGTADLERFKFVFHRTYAGRIFEFAIGAQAALTYLKRPARPPGRGVLTYVGIVGICLSVAFLVMRQDSTPTLNSLRAENGMVLNQLFLNLVFPFFPMLLIYGLSTERTPVSRFLSLPPMTLLGRASYTFYLIHVGFVAGIVFDRLKLGVLLGFIALNLIAIAILLLYEEPMRRLIRGRRAPVIAEARTA
jgi:peptidoglycan/LPS O-acetylase OafA/YrhL